MVPKLAAKARINLAKTILDSKFHRETVESCVAAMLNHEWRAERLKEELKAEQGRPAKKEERKAVQRVAGLLHRLNVAIGNSDLPAGIRKSLQTDFLVTRQKELEAIAKRPLKKPRASDPNPKKKKKRPDRTNLRWDAARYASLTLQVLDIERTTTRAGTLHRLAAAYFGYKDADLFDYIRFWHDVDHLDAEED